MILMLAMKKNNIFTLSFHDISQYLNLTLSSSPIPFSSGPHFLRTLEEPEIKLPTSAGSQKKQGNSRKTSTSASLTYTKAFDCVDLNKLWTILKGIGIPDHLTCLLRNLCAGQEATVRTGHGMMDWFKIGKGVYIFTLLI